MLQSIMPRSFAQAPLPSGLSYPILPYAAKSLIAFAAPWQDSKLAWTSNRDVHKDEPSRWAGLRICGELGELSGVVGLWERLA